MSQVSWTGINLFDPVADLSSHTSWQEPQITESIYLKSNTATSCVEASALWHHSPLWCLWKGEQFGLISCCQGQVGFFEDKSHVSNTKTLDRRHHEIRWCTLSSSLICVSYITAARLSMSTRRSLLNVFNLILRHRPICNFIDALACPSLF